MYRRYGNQGLNKLNQTTQPQFVPKELSKQQLKQWESIFLMINHFLKAHKHQNSSFSFTKIKRFSQIKKKYTSFLINKLHLLQKRKVRQYLKLSFANFQSNRISFYRLKREEHNKKKQNLKNKATSLIVSISTKLNKLKMKNYFQQLRTRAGLSYKLKKMKNIHLFNILTTIRINKIQQYFHKIHIFGKTKLQHMRRLSRLQKQIILKQQYFLRNGFMKLKFHFIKARQIEVQQKQTQAKKINTAEKVVPQLTAENNNQKELQAQVRRLENEQKILNEKKKKMERQLQRIESQNQRTLNQFKKQIERLENENSELIFNHDLLQQNTQELEKQYQSKQKSYRKKISKGQIWQNVYNNLIYFLTVNKDKKITKEALLECLEIPLVPCNLNIQDLTQQNEILSELLNEYKKNFPQPQNSIQNAPDLLPFDVIRKQNRYYYMVLEVLSQWGLPGSKQLQQLNSDLVTIQKKLIS